MALFPVSVLKKYLKLQDVKIIDKTYKKFTSYFQHPEIQEMSKEEQFQATFLNELFEHQYQIGETDSKIGQMVYDLYALTEEEIKIVEHS